MKHPLFKIFCILSCSACITIAPRRGDNDLSNKIQFQDKIYVNNAEVYFREYSYEDIKTKVLNHQNLVVVLFAPWCAGSYNDFISHNYSTLEKHNPDVLFLYVSTNYDLKNLEKLSRYTSSDTIYILDSEIYGSDEGKKIMKLRNQICTDCEEASGVPQHFYFKSGELVKSGGGKITQADLEIYD